MPRCGGAGLKFLAGYAGFPATIAVGEIYSYRVNNMTCSELFELCCENLSTLQKSLRYIRSTLHTLLGFVQRFTWSCGYSGANFKKEVLGHIGACATQLYGDDYHKSPKGFLFTNPFGLGFENWSCPENGKPPALTIDIYHHITIGWKCFPSFPRWQLWPAW